MAGASLHHCRIFRNRRAATYACPALADHESDFGGLARRIHIWTGAGLVLAVVVHVTGLLINSPPDIVAVLLFRSPTPFSARGALAM